MGYEDILKDYPLSIEKNIKYRVELNKLCVNDPTLVELIKNFLRRNTYESLQYFVDVFCWAKNPRLIKQKRHSDVPFICFTAQRKFLKKKHQAIRQGYDSGTEKTREEGVTYLMLYIVLYFWLFVDGGGCRVTSWKDDFVDKIGDENTLFGKLRYIYGMFPQWLLPVGFDKKKHDTYAKIINPENNNSIIGEAPTSSFASSARCLFLFIDELSKIDPNKQEGLWTATADVTDCRLPVWTPKGIGNKAHYLATSGEIEIVRLHWTMDNRKIDKAYYFDEEGKRIDVPDPLQDSKLYKIWEDFYNRNMLKVPFSTGLKGGRVRSEWYDIECLRRNEQEIAQELDIDYLGSGFPFFDLQKLSAQKPYDFTVRQNEEENIPKGKFITGFLVNDGLSKLRFIESADGWLRIFEFPKEKRKYAYGADTSMGLGLDFSVAIVADRYTYNTIATIKCQMSPADFADCLALVGKFYNDALAIPENNTIGQATVEHLLLHPLGVNMYYGKDNFGDMKQRAGFNTNVKTRAIILDNFKRNINQCVYNLRDPDLINECKNFIVNPDKNKAEASKGCNDDCVFARAILDYVLKQEPVVNNKGLNISGDLFNTLFSNSMYGEHKRKLGAKIRV